MKNFIKEFQDITMFCVDFIARFYGDILKQTGYFGRCLVNLSVGLTIIFIVGANFVVVTNFSRFAERENPILIIIFILICDYIIFYKVWGMLKALETQKRK